MKYYITFFSLFIGMQSLSVDTETQYAEWHDTSSRTKRSLEVNEAVYSPDLLRVRKNNQKFILSSMYDHFGVLSQQNTNSYNDDYSPIEDSDLYTESPEEDLIDMIPIAYSATSQEIKILSFDPYGKEETPSLLSDSKNHSLLPAPSRSNSPQRCRSLPPLNNKLSSEPLSFSAELITALNSVNNNNAPMKISNSSAFSKTPNSLLSQPASQHETCIDMLENVPIN